MNPGSYRIPDSVHDARMFPWRGDLCRRFFNGQLVAQEEEFQYLSSQGKTLECIPPDDARLDKSPHHGVTWEFWDRLEGLGMTEYLLKVVYFFQTISALSQQYKWNGFVVSTCNLDENLCPKFTAGEQQKEIVGVLCNSYVDREASGSMGGNEGVDMERLLDMGNQASGGTVNRSLPLLKISVGITGTVFECKRKDEEYRSKRQLFGCVRIEWLLNVEFMEFMMVSLC